MNYIQMLRSWLDAAQESSGNVDVEGDDFELERLSHDDRVALQVDLDGVRDSAHDILHALDKMLRDQPSSDCLADVLADVATNMQHANFHWQDLAGRLGAADMLPWWEESEAD